MCFSASASFGAAAVVGGLGAATLPMVRDRREMLFASLPLAFAVHQLLEGIIWQQVEEAGQTSVRSGAVVAWLFFAWLVLPIWIPISVSLFEPDPRRRRWMRWLAVLGTATGVYLFVSSIVLTSSVSVDQRHLQYQLPLHPGWLLAVPYIAATCLPLLLSSRRFVVHFGIAILVAMLVTVAVAEREFSSVWCFFAALLSIDLLVHYALEKRAERPSYRVA